MKSKLSQSKVYIVISIVIMVILFYSSSKTYTEQSSVPLLQKWLASEPFASKLQNVVFHYGGNEVSIQAMGYFKFVEFFIRKAAHFFTFFILGGSLFLILHSKLKQSLFSLFFAWFSATGYAAMDEFHQMITGDRTPLFQDVMLDSIGALTACVMLVIYLEFGRKKSR
ncbi:VanZ family protein [Vagococcus luciliae]|uniref:VanZ-like domain-containing protein n=1 Tax=Vagococcus luciliae TaxID=2920380 RepID=A0ABY5NYD8_9ENTE|nr:VanZ family protein [Vagococcus luciliae]UUV98674.1 hypothetical protein G314FT_08280 [Vagococcus luciliae]